jgi:NADH:ubiquinone oxidoreductase subunit 5 (subunit L)/multisubunit Na+/H+ antiporter MnhA subunit
MTDSSLVLAAILLPTLGSLLLPLIGMASKVARNLTAAVLILLALCANAALISTVLWSGQVVETSLLGLRMVADGLAVFVAATSSLISLIIVIYSFDYIDHYDYQSEYYLMVTLFVGSMMGLVYSGNLIPLFVFWEITAIVSWRLIGYFRKDSDVLPANKSFLVTVFGALLMLIGFVMLWSSTGSFDLAAIKSSQAGAPISDVAFVLIMAGILSKSATLPFHTWLPDAGVAPSPVTSLLHAAVLVKIGVYVFARLFVAGVAYSAFGHTLVLVLAAASALVSAGAALVETDLKRIIAFSTVSQIAFIFLGLVAGTRIGVTGALLYILMHGLAKGCLFLCAGIIEQKTHTKDIRRMGGLWRRMPITALSFLLCSLSVMGMPPFGGFFSKAMVLIGAAEAGYWWITATFVLGAIFTILYLTRVYNRVFMGEPSGEGQSREGSRTMVGSVATLTVLSIVAGVAINWPGKLAESAVNQMLGIIK